MLTEHDRTHRMDDPDPDHIDGEAPISTETTSHYPVLEEPSWLDDDDLEEMEAPRDSAFRGIWIGAVAAGITFVLVFAVPHWLGWYDIGPSTPRASRELNPESAPVCLSGTCSTEAVCVFPFVSCGGICVDPTSDPDNCGGCGVQCAASEACIFGFCESGSG